MKLLLLPCALLLAACPASPRRGVQTGYGPDPNYTNPVIGGSATSAQAGTQASGDPREALNQLNTHLQQLGYQRLGPAIRNANMPENGVIGYAIDTAPGSCYVSVVIGPSNVDLNLVVLDPMGQTVGYNVSPDARPWVTICPYTPGRHIARVQMARGGGEYYYAVFRGPPQNRPDLAQFFGTGGAAQTRTATIDTNTRQRLTALDQQLSRDRFMRVGDPQGFVLSEREERHFELPRLEQGRCYAFATLGGEGARDTNVVLADGSGNEIARDVADAVDGVVRYCPTTTGTYSLRGHMYGGQGPLFAVAYVQNREGFTPSQTTAPVIAQHSTTGAGLDENFRLLDADMRARGYEAYGQPQRGELGQSQSREFAISLEGGKCYAILAVGDTGVRNLDLLLLNSSGRQMDRDIETDARPIVRVCPPTSGDFRMQVQAQSGQGNFVYAPYQWPRGTRGPFGLRGLIYVRLAEVTSLLAIESYEPDPDYEPDKGRVRENQTQRHNLRLEAGKCYSVLVVGGEGVNDLDATLMRGNTALASDGTRSAFPSVRLCPNESDSYSLEIRATNGAGEYFYQVFRRSAGG